MTVYTPRGLKIRVPADYCFALITRLRPKVSALQVLRTTEGLECIPGTAAFIAGMLGFGLRMNPLHLAGTVAAAYTVGSVMTKNGLFWIPGLPALGTLYSVLAGRGLLLAVQVFFGWSSLGWRGVAALYGGAWVAAGLSFAYDSAQTSRRLKKHGVYMDGADASFISAYRLHATGIGLTPDIELAEPELAPERWQATYEAYAAYCPESAAKSE